ncbi:Radial spoke head 1 [Coelomomyces lativittatus]|nr:Radial spoke head 1 [Coelomomyces lativittatus]KAJ1507589.1 Radial spoke head 1 [Coelomomyces lativittatus]KAJ1509999.1 Radial spoke head 1 [Coelomomyces lativittatus]
MSENGSEADPQEQLPTIGTYVGDRAATGERHGKGTNTFPNGDVYEGEYEAGQRQGHGMYTWKKLKAKYIGQYFQNRRHGDGLFAYPDGSRYKGQFKNGLRHGQGTYLYADGDTFQGQWDNNLKHGTGVYTFAASESKIEGTWDQGWLSGETLIRRSDHVIHGVYTPIKEAKPPSSDSNENNSGPLDVVIDSKLTLPCSIEYKSCGFTTVCNVPEQVGMGVTSPVSEET